jgi:anaerobic selenocysteine-containing dehydrogenase
MDPCRQTLSRHATMHLQFKPGTDVAMLNAMSNTIITEGLADEQYIACCRQRSALRAGLQIEGEARQPVSSSTAALAVPWGVWQGPAPAIRNPACSPSLDIDN